MDSVPYQTSTLVVSGTVAVVAVRFLGGWVQIVAGALVGMLAVAISAGRVMHRHLSQQEPAAARRSELPPAAPVVHPYGEAS